MNAMDLRVKNALTRTDARGTCQAHGVSWCIACVTDELHNAHYERVERRIQLKRERREMTVCERFDIGGES
jgi:hypothetical protein